MYFWYLEIIGHHFTLISSSLSAMLLNRPLSMMELENPPSGQLPSHPILWNPTTRIRVMARMT